MRESRTGRPSARVRASARPLYTGLRVRDLDRSVQFYKALGFHQTIRRRTSIGVFVQLEHPTNRFTIELNYFDRGSSVYEPYRRGSEIDHIGFWVDDVDAWVGRLRRVGGTVKHGPFDSLLVIPPRPSFRGRAAFVSDPDRVWIELMGPPRRKPRGARAAARATGPRSKSSR